MVIVDGTYIPLFHTTLKVNNCVDTHALLEYKYNSLNVFGYTRAPMIHDPLKNRTHFELIYYSHNISVEISQLHLWI